MEARKLNPHYTIADYLQWEGDWELWNGVAVAMSPSPTFRHQEVVSAMVAELFRRLRDASCRCRVVVEHDWHVDHDTVMRPDAMVVCREFEGDFLNVPPTLIVEVLSPSTSQKDRTSKRSLYAAEGVGHYLIVEPASASVEVLELHGGAYELLPADPDYRVTLRTGCTIRLPAVIDV